MEEDELESKECALRRFFSHDWEILKPILDGIVASGAAAQPSDVNKIRSLLDKYQEASQLLEPYLESIVVPLMHLIRSLCLHLGASSDNLFNTIKPLCIIVYTLVNVCGYKAIIRFFPHQVSDLEIAVSLLERCHRASAGTTSLRQESTGEMETKCVVLLWLYILVLIPFDISTIDTSMSNCADKASCPEEMPLVKKVLEISKDYLSSAGPMRRISGLLLARLLTRPDMDSAFKSFIQWAHEIMSSLTDDFLDQFKLLGLMEALASIFKTGSRKVLLSIVSDTWTGCLLVVKSPIATRSSMLRKYTVKLVQRIGLICLPPRSPSWRYLTKSSSLSLNLSIDGGEVPLSEFRDDPGNRDVDPSASSLDDDEIDVPEIVEEIIELLLTRLRDSDTIVRWSAAKGIGRITACLTSSLSEQILSSILELFSAGEGDGSWHGGCLALAELARRGLLLPNSFPTVIPVIIKALHYDVRRGPHSIGSHVRDAAAYVCWAFGRAYLQSDMKHVLKQLAPHLLILACYDREVNCRRAASAAFQENVGRQGDFPDGITIVNEADYFNLATRSNSYLSVAVSIAQYDSYLYAFADELTLNKITHWEKSLRELASQALAALAHYDTAHFAGPVLEKLIPSTLSSDLCTRHGATLAIAELVLALHQLGFTFSNEKQEVLAGVVPAIEKAQLYRGKGGEIMRSAVSRFVECMSLARISMGEKTKRALLETLNENIKHPNSQIQLAAVEALKFFVPSYIPAPADDVVLKYLEFLSGPNVAARRGSALALGALPAELLFPRMEDVIQKLCSACMLEGKPDDMDAEARVNAVRGLISVCETLTSSSAQEDTLYPLIRDKVMSALFEALDDYAVDNRGDVGSWIREAAINALERCAAILCRKGSEFFDSDIATRLVGGFVKQAAEKMDKIRDIAGKALQRILLFPFLPDREILAAIIPDDNDLNWSVPAAAFLCVVKFLSLERYSRQVLAGLVTSAGGLQESLRRVAVAALVSHLETSGQEAALRRDFLWVLQQYAKCDRVVMPLFKTIEVLLSKKFLLDSSEDSRSFCEELCGRLAGEMKGSKDFSKLSAGLSILGYISSHASAPSSMAFSQLLGFLGHRYPKIRKAAADQAYLALLQNGSNLVVMSTEVDRTVELISETCWDGDLNEAKIRRSELYLMSGITSAVATSRAELVEKDGKVVTVSIDENKSYSSLLDFAGF